MDTMNKTNNSDLYMSNNLNTKISTKIKSKILKFSI